MLRDSYPMYLANKAVFSKESLDVLDKYSHEIACKVSLANREQMEKGIEAAHKSRKAMAALPPYERQAILYHCIKRFEERFEELAYCLCVEAGKPIKDARGEVTRLIDTFRIAAEEAVRLEGQLLNLEISARAKGYHGQSKPFPVGACGFISPFNFPLNLVAHKVAPAIAAGCPFVLKPASRTPVGALIIGEILSECELPEGAFSILPCSREDADQIVTDDRLKVLSFTGSQDVGWDLKARAGKKKVVLELGGNAACIVDEDTDIADAVNRIIFGAFYQSGQSCVSVQRIMVHRAVYADFKDQVLAKVENLVCGDPKDEATFIGPMISEGEAKRLESWIQEAVGDGAKKLCGGKRDGAILSPCIIEDAPKDSKIYQEEAFGPVATLESFDDFYDALARVNDSKFGLQAGVFTRDLYKAQDAWNELEVGGVIIGDVPSWRVDNMPYGGVKESGLGREGVRYAIEHLCESKLMVTRRID